MLCVHSAYTNCWIIHSYSYSYIHTPNRAIDCTTNVFEFDACDSHICQNEHLPVKAYDRMATYGIVLISALNAN